MKPGEAKAALSTMAGAARAVGRLMRQNLAVVSKKVNSASQHDIKLDLDVRSQKLIERRLRRAYPRIALFGEEGVAGNPEAEHRWVVDPIDGTVNFTYGIPHACISIALQEKRGTNYRTLAGVVYDPFLDEMWSAIRGQSARLNGRIIRVTQRRKLREAIVAMGFAKNETTMKRGLPAFLALLPRVRKIRLLGAAALSMTWVAAGRMDAYLEFGVRLWDIAAGGLIVECAGGEFWHRALEGDETYRICVNNGQLRPQIEKVIGKI
jgi:myo-inositol-1(or 4)-monophosphatase